MLSPISLQAEQPAWLSELDTIKAKLFNLTDFTPRAEVNYWFTQLVNSALHIGPEVRMLQNKQITDFQSIAAKGEIALEAYWSKLIYSSTDPTATLRAFPYLDNYIQLTVLEWEHLQRCAKHKSHKILFVGGGPLPLTAIVLAQQYSQSITIIDNCEMAVDSSQQLIKKLGLSSLITVELAQAQTFTHYPTFNTVWIAAMVGMTTTEKIAIFKKLKAKLGQYSHIVTRSSWDGRSLLYPPIPENVKNSLELVSETKPAAPIINSILIFQT